MQSGSSNSSQTTQNINSRLTDGEVFKQMQQLIDQQASVHIATVNSSGQPEASYAPFIAREKSVYLYLSKLAVHSRNLQQNPKLSLLFIEPEGESVDVFARKRVTWKCELEAIQRESELWQEIMDQFEMEHGKTVQLIRQLSDFTLYCCRPVKANVVLGFAKAYTLRF
ncbi:HugZ family protein [Thiomicrorhabdus indica]|uniref:HugZ family pyridoxamine 5'-phosphate oxidase n=1 Tax=Thiomicrorhabdus indica TaxID=2267253 RepID=UPI002AA7AAE7|nr:pyridoxamine 5'-phosphate oxidase family protein [Thiomicrorhabdus indica]